MEINMYTQEEIQHIFNKGIEFYIKNFYKANLHKEEDRIKIVNWFIKTDAEIKNLQQEKTILQGFSKCMLDKKLNQKLKAQDKDGKGGYEYNQKEADDIILDIFNKLKNSLKDIDSSKSLTSSASSK